MHASTLIALLTLVSGVACGGRGRLPHAPMSSDGRAAQAAIGPDWLEVRFPAIALANTGCMYPNTLRSGEVRRWYQWRVTADFPDRQYPDNHFMGVYVFFGLPDSVPLTAARLDSALAAVQLTVDEFRWEPPRTAARVVPSRAWARREGDRLLLRVEGRAAIRAFLRARTDSVDVGWCQRNEYLTATRVPLARL